MKENRMEPLKLLGSDELPPCGVFGPDTDITQPALDVLDAHTGDVGEVNSNAATDPAPAA